LKTTTDPHFKATLLSASAEMHMRTGDYELAASTYQTIVDSSDNQSRDAARANLVLACSYFDQDRAAKEASALPSPSLLSITAEDLEESLAPSNVSRSKKESKKDDEGIEGEEKEKRQRRESQAQAAQKAMLESRKKRILKRRAKRRLLYLEKLRNHPDNKNLNSLPKPDPERWIPKRLRHSKTRNRGRRGREKQMQGGHQGGVVSQNDLDKFDAKAKKERDDAAAAETKSNNNNKNGKKKGKKKGKRR
jgi:hypothetical protein